MENICRTYEKRPLQMKTGNERYAQHGCDCAERPCYKNAYYACQHRPLSPLETSTRHQWIREECEDTLMKQRELGGAHDDNLFPVGRFSGENITKTDYHGSELPEIQYWKPRARKLDLPPFKGKTSHQSDYEPPFFGDGPIQTPTHPVPKYPSRSKSQPDMKVEVQRPLRLLKDFRRMDYTTTHQKALSPPAKWGYVTERFPKFKWPYLTCLQSDPTYKQSSIYKLDYVYYKMDPDKPEFITTESEMININPHPILKF